MDQDPRASRITADSRYGGKTFRADIAPPPAQPGADARPKSTLELHAHNLGVLRERAESVERRLYRLIGRLTGQNPEPAPEKQGEELPGTLTAIQREAAALERSIDRMIGCVDLLDNLS